MNQLSTLRRRLHLIRLVEAPFLYHTKRALVTRLQEHDVEAVSERTVERDIAAISREYGIHIRLNRQRGGYYLDLPADEDLADFRQFVELLERRERLAFLTSATERVRHVSRFLQLEQAPRFSGAEHLPVLWEALGSSRCVAFSYQKFTDAIEAETVLLTHQRP